MLLTFWGAARQVTGSMHLLEFENGYRLLIDCGVDFSREARNNSDFSFPFNPASIDMVLLTHAHLDHCGNIPALYSGGYQGQVICTAPTLELTHLLLHDYAEVNAEKFKQKAASGNYNSRRPDYEDPATFSHEDIEETLNQFRIESFHRKFEIQPDVFVTFIPAGHLLGAASIYIEAKENNQIKTIGFSGDRGRINYPLLLDPEPLPPVDYLICETTYGSRSHHSELNAEDEIAAVIQESCIDKAGRLIVPAFSIGRTQTLLYILYQLSKRNKLSSIRVFTDSPMAEKATQVYQKYASFLNSEAKSKVDKGESLFDFENLVQVQNYKESKAISGYAEPCVIISSSGMITGGRMQHHIKKNIDNPYCTVLVIGYSAEGTPGHQLTNGSKSIRLKGRDIPIAANIVVTDVFSGHADREDLLDFVKTQDKQKIKNIFLVHGEFESMESFKELISEHGYNKVELPKKGESFQL